MDISIGVMLTAAAVILSIFDYTCWTKYRRHQLRRSAALLEQQRAFELQQLALGLDTAIAAIAAQFAIGADDAVAGEKDRQRIAPASMPDNARTELQLVREGAIRARLA